MKLLTPVSRLLLCASLALSTAACNKDDDSTVTPTPTPIDSSMIFAPQGPRPMWGPTMDDSMLVVIEQFLKFSNPPIEGLTPQEARMLPTIADAVKQVIGKYKIQVPPSMVDTSGRTIPVAGGSIHARIYTPRNAGGGPFPVIVYYQGGGFVIADVNVYDASCRALSEMSGAVVVSVQYRKGPEFKFPTAHNDAFAAYKWVLNNASSINVNPARIAVAGESAGGNLACNVSIAARDSGVTMPRHQMLVYPVANNDLNAPSVLQYRDARPLNRAMLEWFFFHYLNNMGESNDPRIKLVAANLSGLPPTTILNAEIDPLRDDGAALQTALQSAGVQVTRRLYSGLTHEAFGTGTVVAEAKDMQMVASAALKAALQ